MLLQHKAELGVKRVTNVVIFKDDSDVGTYVSVHLLFKVADVASAVGARMAVRDGDGTAGAGNDDTVVLGKLVGGVRTHELFY